MGTTICGQRHGVGESRLDELFSPRTQLGATQTMRSLLLVVASFAITVFCWGVYGPVLHWGQEGMEKLTPLWLLK
ncbi:MAG: hypothetical protein AAF961_08815, partial [Planctomycetota bacterium]